jgi:hypothetical protein
MTYGKSSAGNYAVARESNKIHGVWDACEVDGELYRVIDAQDIPESDWERTDALELAAGKKAMR